MGDRPSLERVQDLLRQGESEHVEFKHRLAGDSDIARSLVAFANADGGLLLIGVEETPRGARVAGLSDAEARQTLDRLRRLTRSLLSTPIPVGLIEIEGEPVVYASVNPLPPHLRPATTATGDVYQRVASSDRRVVRDSAAIGNAVDSTPLRVFVAMSLREEEEPALADYFRAMGRAAERVGQGRIELVRIDQIEGDYEISAEIMRRIDECDAVLADFTLSPRNVYFEVGYARGVKEPVIQTARKDTTLEFDIRNWRTLFYRNATELEEALLAAFADLLAKR